MNCQQWDELMMRYFDKLTDELETKTLKQHITQCSRCTEQFNQLREILGSLEIDIEIDPPLEFEKDVMSKINDYVLYNRDASRKYQTALVIGIISVLSIPLLVFGMIFSNLSFSQMVLDTGIYIHHLFNLWLITSMITRNVDIFLAGLDFLLVKTILATVIIYGVLSIVTKVKLSKRNMGLNS